MRRSVAIIVGTLAGAALLIGAKLATHPAHQPAPPAPVRNAPSEATSTPSARRWTDARFTGAVAAQRYGTVTIAVSPGRLVGAGAV
jgi:hypothetical protein